MTTTFPALDVDRSFGNFSLPLSPSPARAPGVKGKGVEFLLHKCLSTHPQGEGEGWNFCRSSVLGFASIEKQMHLFLLIMT